MVRTETSVLPPATAGLSTRPPPDGLRRGTPLPDVPGNRQGSPDQKVTYFGPVMLLIGAADDGGMQRVIGWLTAAVITTLIFVVGTCRTTPPPMVKNVLSPALTDFDSGNEF